MEKQLDYEQVLEQYRPMISAIIRDFNIYKDFEDYEQIAMLALWKATQIYDEERGAFSSIAYTLMKRAVGDALRKNIQAAKQTPVESDTLQHLTESSTDENETLEWLILIFEKLSPEERKLAHMYWIEEIPNDELAELFQISYDGVTKRKYRLLTKLKKIASSIQKNET